MISDIIWELSRTLVCVHKASTHLGSLFHLGLIVFVNLVLNNQHIPGFLQLVDGICVGSLQFCHMPLQI